MWQRIASGGLVVLALTAGAEARKPGTLDKALVTAAGQAVGVSKVKVFTQPSGAVRKLSVYHHDPDKVPAAVKAAAEKAYPGSTVTSYESELYADVGEAYEVELKTADGKKVEFSAKPDGTLLYVETAIPEAEVPEQVMATATALVLGGKFIEAERKQGKDTLEFAVKLEKDGLKHYLHLAPDGTLKRHTLRIPAEFEVEVATPKR